MRDGKSIELALFFTRGLSLRAWDECGMFSRELAIYRRLMDRGVRITFVTYGDESERRYADRLGGVRICCNDGRLPPERYAADIPRLHEEALRSVDLIKTNQTPGADTALHAAGTLGKPLIARCGYLWSEFADMQSGPDSPAAVESRRVEDVVFHAADRVVVTTPAMKANIVGRFPDLASLVHVVPNYVDTDVFRPADERPVGSGRLCYVGRLEQVQKNVRVLIDAVRDLDVQVDIIGDGPLRREFEEEAIRNPRLRIVGKVPNERLPEHLRACEAFVFPSVLEGHPKTLIEAMACGLPVIAADVPGVNNVVEHGRTGWLGAPTAEGLRAGIQTVLGDRSLADRLARNARRFVLEQYALDRVVEMELAGYREVLSAPMELVQGNRRS